MLGRSTKLDIIEPRQFFLRDRVASRRQVQMTCKANCHIKAMNGVAIGQPLRADQLIGQIPALSGDRHAPQVGPTIDGSE
jgi:hypothetical protein